MRLKSIEIQGFKSFADKTTLRFGEGITAVVGPNGSGKSNISDAVRWVLGEQSNKTLRGNKMEDVIFGGTNTRKRLGFAEVSLAIDNTDRSLDCDTDEVTVTRRYYRSGESEYRINNASVRLKDINELFMDTGLGRDGYSIVGQGKIDDIVSTKTSSERRDIFEEAAGISKYRYRKTEAERKLSQAEDNLVRLRDILAELEGRVGPLKEQSRKATVFLEYSKELEELQIGLWLNTLVKYKDLLRDQEHKIATARAQYEDINAQIAELESGADRSAEESLRLNAMADEARRTASTQDESAVKTEADIVVLQSTIEHNNETVSRIMSDINELENGGATVADDITEKKLQISEKRADLEKKKIVLDKINEELLGIITRSDEYSSVIDRITAQLNALSLKASDDRVLMMTTRTTIDEITGRMAAVNSEISEKEEAQNKLTIELNALNDDLKAIDNTIDECTNSVNGKQMIIKMRSEKAEKLKQKLDALVMEENEKRHRAKILEELDRNMEGFGYAAKSVMKAANQSQLRGIHGPVSKIIHVDSKYSLAIEAALGATIQHIIVDDESAGKHAINYLKSRNAGRATFLPISAIRPRTFRENGLDECFGYIDVANKLVSCDKKYADVVSYLLGGTVVADNLDSAASIAKKFNHRFKIVTLDGQIMNAGGSMTGGSVSKNAGILSRSGEIKAFIEQADKIAAEIKDTKALFEKAKNELSEMEADILVSRSAVTTAQEDKIRILGEVKRVSEQLDAIKQSKQSLVSEKGACDIRVKELNGEELRAKDSIELTNAKINELQKSLEDKIGGRDNSSAKREELSAKASDVKTAIFEMGKDIEVLENAVEELSGRTSDRENRIVRLRAEIDSINAQNTDIGGRIGELTELAKSYRNAANTARDSVADIISKRDSLDKSVQEMRVKERSITADKEKISGELVRLEERKISMVHDYDDTIKKLYDEYGLTRSEAEEKGHIPDDIPEAKKRLIELKSKIRSLGSVNVSAIEEYKEVSERYEFMSAQITDVETSKSELISLIQELTSQMQELFIDRFNSINAYFGKIFTELFGGGTAELKLTDPNNTLESGIEIICQPPGKKVSIIEQLSGGEKALIAISIYFAVMKVNPPPFCMLDEVDAALDDVNVTRFADYLRRMSNMTQYIVVTHRRGSMEEADMLYGVTMQEKGVTKLLELNVSELESKLNLKQY